MSERVFLGVLVVFTVLVFLGTAVHPALLDDADAGHAAAAKEILERQDWVTFYINGIRYLEKGPLLFWSGALAFQLVGVNELGARLPAVAAVLGLALVCYAFGQAFGGPRTGFYAGLMAASSFGTYLYTRIFIPDILLTFCIAAVFYCFWRGLSQSHFFWGFWAALAGAVLAKGLIGIVFPLAAVGLYIAIERRWDIIPKMRPLPGILLFLLLAAPWHILAALRTPKWAWFYFVNEHFLRYLGKRYPRDYDKVPLLLFWGLNLAWLFPWSSFLPLTVRRRTSRLMKKAVSGQRGQARMPVLQGESTSCETVGQASWPVLLWIWAGVVMVFFSFSTRQEYYTMPAWPALFLLLSDALVRAEEGAQQRWLARLQAIPMVLGGAVALALAALLWLSRGVTVQGDIASLLTRNPEMYRLSLGHLFDLQVGTFAALRIPAACAAVILSCGFGLAWWLRKCSRHFAATLATAVTAGAFFFCAQGALGAFEPYLSSKTLARAIQRSWRPGDRVVVNGEYYTGSSIGFYLRPKVYLLNGRMAGLEFGSHYPDAPQVFIGDQDLQKWWPENPRIFLFTEGESRPRVERLLPPGSVHEVAASGGKFVLSNRP